MAEEGEERGGGAARIRTVCMGGGPGFGGARAPNCTAPTTLSLCLNAALTTSYGCGPLVTPPCYDDEVCSEFQLLELPDRLCSSARPSEYQLSTHTPPPPPPAPPFLFLERNEEVAAGRLGWPYREGNQ